MSLIVASMNRLKWLSRISQIFTGFPSHWFISFRHAGGVLRVSLIHKFETMSYSNYTRTRKPPNLHQNAYVCHGFAPCSWE